MRKAATFAILIGTAAAWLGGIASINAADPDVQKFDQVEKGHYLATVADCFACHTVPKVGKPYAGARPLETPVDRSEQLGRLGALAELKARLGR